MGQDRVPYRGVWVAVVRHGSGVRDFDELEKDERDEVRAQHWGIPDEHLRGARWTQITTPEVGADYIELLRRELAMERQKRWALEATLADLPRFEAQEIARLRRDLEAASKKWQEYEQEYILPVFKMAKEAGIDLASLVIHNPGKNCIRAFFEELMKLAKEKRDA